MEVSDFGDQLQSESQDAHAVSGNIFISGVTLVAQKVNGMGSIGRN